MRVKLILIGSLIAIPSVAIAQQTLPSEYVLKITSQELDLIGKALVNQPYNDVAQFLQKLHQQVIEQQHHKKDDQEPKK